MCYQVMISDPNIFLFSHRGLFTEVDNKMIGTIPAELRHLRHLKVFWIDNNNGISGSIPFQLETLNELEICKISEASHSVLISFNSFEILTLFAIAHSEFGGPFSYWYNTSSIWQLEEVKNTSPRGKCGYCHILV